MVVDQLKHDFYNFNFPIISSNKKKDVKTLNLLEMQIKKEQQKLLRVREAYEAGIDTLAEYKENKVRITEKISELQTKLAAKDIILDKKDFAAKHQKNLDIILDPNSSEPEKNSAFREIVEKVIFSRPQGSIQIFYRG